MPPLAGRAPPLRELQSAGCRENASSAAVLQPLCGSKALQPQIAMVLLFLSVMLMNTLLLLLLLIVIVFVVRLVVVLFVVAIGL
jgi:hypothetical protein